MTRTSPPAPLPAGEGYLPSMTAVYPRGGANRVLSPFPLSAKRAGHVCPCSSGVRFGERGPGGVGHRHA